MAHSDRTEMGHRPYFSEKEGPVTDGAGDDALSDARTFAALVLQTEQ